MSLWTNTIISLAFNPAEGVLKHEIHGHYCPSHLTRDTSQTELGTIIPIIYQRHIRLTKTHQQHMRTKQLEVCACVCAGGDGRKRKKKVFFFFFFKMSTDTDAQQPTEKLLRVSPSLHLWHPARSLRYPNHCCCLSHAPPSLLLLYFHEKPVIDVIVRE